MLLHARKYDSVKNGRYDIRICLISYERITLV